MITTTSNAVIVREVALNSCSKKISIFQIIGKSEMKIWFKVIFKLVMKVCTLFHSLVFCFHSTFIGTLEIKYIIKYIKTEIKKIQEMLWFLTIAITFRKVTI